MASRISVKKKTITKRNRASVRGVARRKKVTIRNRGRGNVNVARVGIKK